MIGEILCVGTELLLGDILNTNAQFLAKQCAVLGLDCFYHTVVGDNKQRLLEQIQMSLKRCDVLFITGGLGPTYDDITKETVALALGETLVFHQSAYDHIVAYFRQRGKDVLPMNKKQAYTFEDSETILNDVGTAPAHFIVRASNIIVLLQGPPHEMHYNYQKHIEPLLKQYVDDTIVSQSLYLMGIGESEVEYRISEWMRTMVNPTIAPYAMMDGVKLRVSCKAKTHEEAVVLMRPIVQQLKDIFASYVYSMEDARIEDALCRQLIQYDIALEIKDGLTDGLFEKRLQASMLWHRSLLCANIQTLHIYQTDAKEIQVRLGDRIKGVPFQGVVPNDDASISRLCSRIMKIVLDLIGKPSQ